MAKGLKATTRVDLPDVMSQMAEELDTRAAALEGSGNRADVPLASEARALAGEIRLCLGQIELTDSLADGEAATKRLQQLRSLTLEFLARRR